MKSFKRIMVLLIVGLLWTVFIGLGFINGYLLKPLSSSDESSGFMEASKELISKQSVGNLAMVVIEEGEVTRQYFYSSGTPVDENTLYPVASVSKWVSAFGVMKLVEEGLIDLDTPVENYLTRWHLPESEFDHSKVTPRLLLSHSSGLIDDLGYGGFPPGEPVQTVEESLTKAADSDYSDGIAQIGYEPGSQYMYSGAGYTLLQLLIEEVSNMSFEDYMEQRVFKPLQMNTSTFSPSNQAKQKLAEIYKTDGSTREMNTFTALAAASLYTTPRDMVQFMTAQLQSNPVLSQKSLELMSQPQTYIGDTPIYGLGPHLFSQNQQDSNVIGHDGSGNDAINTAARLDLLTGNGIIVFETGNYSLASNLADEWLFWSAGVADYVVMQRNKSYLLKLWAAGLLVFVLAFVVLLRTQQKRNK